MALETLKITHLRNISKADLRFSAGINLISGANASGKTSLLEAVSLMCQGRSFRTPRFDQLIQHQQGCLTVVGTLLSKQRRHTIGIAREQKKTTVKLDGAPVTRSTDLINLETLHVITPESHEILDQGPKMRRQYLDWGVFHVKPDYLANWQRYHRVLRQRNHVLRQGGDVQSIQAWNKPLLTEANTLHQQRISYLDSLSPLLKDFGHQLLEKDVEFDYRPGWSKSAGSLAEQLSMDLAQDQARGFTQSGPHRADIKLTADDVPIKQVFSRGQQKLLICAMYLAQVAHSPNPGILLIDDLPAELDSDRRGRLLAAAATTRAQLFVTTTDANLIDIGDFVEKKVFHVERGEFHEVV